jgi:hypothetical protein
VGTILPPKDVNLTVLEEENVGLLAYMALFLGVDSSRSLPWSGTISDSGWTYVMNTPYLDGTLTTNLSGTYDSVADVVSWAGESVFTNSVGDLTVDTDGTYTGGSQIDPGVYMTGRRTRSMTA